MVVVAILGWILTLITGRLPAGLHRFFVAYIRYVTHLTAYLDARGEPVSAVRRRARRLPGRRRPARRTARQSRWRTLFRLLARDPGARAELAPSAGCPMVAARQDSSGSRRRERRQRLPRRRVLRRRGPRLVREPLDWTDAARPAGRARLRGRLPGAGLAYLLLVTDRYPNADPAPMLATVDPPPVHLVHVARDDDDLRRSRVTVLFRLPLAIPHLVWLMLWSLLAWLAAIVAVVRAARRVPARPSRCTASSAPGSATRSTSSRSSA